MRPSTARVKEWVVGAVQAVESSAPFTAWQSRTWTAYPEEMEWRFNNRNNPCIFRYTLAQIMQTAPLQYRELTA